VVVVVGCVCVYNMQFDWLFQNSGLRMPPTKIDQVDPEPQLSIARHMGLGLPRMKIMDK